MSRGERRRFAVARGGFVVVVVAALLLGAPLAVGSHPNREALFARGADGVRPALNCTGVGWLTTHLWVNLSQCQAGFLVIYAQNFTNWNASDSYNYSFWIDWIAEFTPAGHLVRVASPLSPFASNANVTRVGEEVNLTARYDLNVTSATGNWTPNDTWAGTGPQWNVSNATVGTAVLSVVFHLSDLPVNASANATRNASLSVKFDVGVANWPWVSAGDLLGFDLASLGAGGSHFSFNPTNRTLQEQWNSTNRTFASLVFGRQANVTYPSSPSAPSTVGEQVGMYRAGTPGRESVALVTFGGVAGNYSSVSYDPWVVFSPAGTGTTVPPSLAASPIPSWAPVAGAMVAVLAGVSVIAVYVVRASALRREGLSLVREMRESISNEPLPRSPSK